jgi:hypothetical protein
MDLFRGHVQRFELHTVAKNTWDSYSSMWLPLVIQGVSERALQLYSKCYCVTVQAFKCKHFRNTMQ